MTYQQTISYLYERLPLFSRLGAGAIKTNLTNTIVLCEALGNPQQTFKAIHIAGTNGKGSVSHMLAAILQTAGYKTGLYTSPHLKDFRERIKIDGQLCKEDFVVDFVTHIQPLIEEINPSFFEVTVAMAFDYFAKENVDIAIIETGLGGKLDSTNIITPVLSVITNIGYDHMNILGNSLEEIAYEKAGIIKPSVPVVIGETGEITKPIFIENAEVRDAPIVFAQDKKYVTEFNYQNHLLQVTVDDKKKDEHVSYVLDLGGVYQTKNILTVLESVYQLQLQHFDITQKNVVTALRHVKKLTGLHGRWEVVHEHPSVVLDVAHNEDGIRQIAEQLELMTYNQLYIIIGIVRDKNISKMLSSLPKTAVYYFTKAHTPRAINELELAEIAAQQGIEGHVFADVNSALQEAMTHADTDDLILICGSVFLVGEVNI